MAVPGSGTISLGRIRQELETSNYAASVYTAAATNLDTAENGGYYTLNPCSPALPLAANPARMSEWYGYDHNAPCRYSMDTGNNSGTLNALYRSQNDWGNSISTTAPPIDGTFTLNFWMKLPYTQPIQGYIMSHTFASSAVNAADFRVALNWTTGFNQNTNKWDSYLVLGLRDLGGGFLSSNANLSDNNNTSITGVSQQAAFGPNNHGITATTGFVMITIVYDFNQYLQNGMVTWYWNGNALTVPYNTQGQTSNGDSFTTEGQGAPITSNPPIGTGTLYIGGFVPGEISSNMYTDEFSYIFSTALSSTQVLNLYNNGTPQTTSNIANIITNTNFIHYGFSKTGTLLGEENAGYFDFDLAKYGNPVRVSDGAL